MGIAGVVFAVSIAWSLLQTPVYRSTSEVLVKPINSVSNVYSAPAITLETERRIASSTVVADRAVAEMSPPISVETFLDHLDVNALVDTEVLEFNYTNEDARRAQEGAKAAANAYIAYKAQQRIQDINGLREPLLDEISTLGRRAASLEADIGASGQPTAAQEAELQELTNLIVNLRGQVAPLKTVVIDPGDVIKQATYPSSPSSPKVVLNASFGLLVGLILGIGVGSVRERLDDRIRVPGDLEMLTEVPVLAVIPRMPRMSKRDRHVFVAAEQPKSAAAESYRTLRTSLMFRAGQEGGSIILVTSASNGEGKTTITANLAFALAQAGKRVVAVSGDLRRPALHRFFGVEDAPGLTDILAGRSTLAQSLIESAPNLRFIGSGGPDPLSAEHLASEAMRRLLQELLHGSDFVLIDAPAMREVSDSLVLAAFVRDVILVARAKSTTRSEVMYVRQQLDRIGVRPIGCVLNTFESGLLGSTSSTGSRFARPQPVGPIEPSTVDDDQTNRNTRPG